MFDMINITWILHFMNAILRCSTWDENMMRMFHFSIIKCNVHVMLFILAALSPYSWVCNHSSYSLTVIFLDMGLVMGSYLHILFSLFLFFIYLRFFLFLFPISLFSLLFSFQVRYSNRARRRCNLLSNLLCSTIMWTHRHAVLSCKRTWT